MNSPVSHYLRPSRSDFSFVRLIGVYGCSECGLLTFERSTGMGAHQLHAFGKCKGEILKAESNHKITTNRNWINDTCWPWLDKGEATTGAQDRVCLPVNMEGLFEPGGNQPTATCNMYEIGTPMIQKTKQPINAATSLTCHDHTHRSPSLLPSLKNWSKSFTERIPPTRYVGGLTLFQKHQTIATFRN